MNNAKESIRLALSNALKLEGLDMPPADIILEFPADIAHGDYASNIAMAKAKSLNINPRILADNLVKSMGQIEGVAQIGVAGPGFINFTLSSGVYCSIVESIDGAWGGSESLRGQSIMTEYTDPNPFKEFHIGHLMSNAIGESITRLLESQGATIKRANYQGDVGPHVAKCIWGMQKMNINGNNSKELGRAYSVGANAYETDTVAKSEIEIINAKVYDRSDAEINALYDMGRKTSLAHFEEIYVLLGTKFDFYFFESQTAPIGLSIVQNSDGVFEESDGAIVYKGEKNGLHTRVFINSKGLPTYEAKELGLLQLKSERYKADLYISITASEQSDYFRVVQSVMDVIMPDISTRVEHVSHGMMRFAGGKMSSRKGDVITGESLLQDLSLIAKDRASTSRSDDADVLAIQIAVAAIKYQILKQSSGRDIIFDKDRALSIDGDSGPYLQYAYARTRAIIRKAYEQNIIAKYDEGIKAHIITRMLIKFPDIVARSAQNREPHHVVTYLIEIASCFNTWYAQEQILDGTTIAIHKLAIVQAVSTTLERGLYLLGIPAPEKM